MDAGVEAPDAVGDAGTERPTEIPGGKLVAACSPRSGSSIGAIYLDHHVVLSSDSMNNYVHVWWIARDLWHHGRLPWRMPVLGHGDAYAYPYGFVNWTVAALLWPLFGNWAVTLATRGSERSAASSATFVAFPELRDGWWAAAVLANPAIIESLLFGQQAFAWGAALLLFGIACWRRGRRLAAALLVGLGQATHAADRPADRAAPRVDRHVVRAGPPGAVALLRHLARDRAARGRARVRVARLRRLERRATAS